MSTMGRASLLREPGLDRSLGFDSRVFDDLRRELNFRAQDFPETLRRARNGLEAERLEFRFDLGHLEYPAEFRVEQPDDGRRRTSRNEKTVPRRHVVARKTRFG